AAGGPEQPDRLDPVQRQPRPPVLQGRRPGRPVRGDRRGVRLTGRPAPARAGRACPIPQPRPARAGPFATTMPDLITRIVAAVTRPSYSPVKAKVLAKRLA